MGISSLEEPCRCEEGAEILRNVLSPNLVLILLRPPISAVKDGNNHNANRTMHCIQTNCGIDGMAWALSGVAIIRNPCDSDGV